MQNAVFTQWNEFAAQAMDKARSLEEINSKVASQLAEKNVELMTSWWGTGVKQLDLVSKSKGYADILEGQAKLAQEWNDTFQSAVKDSTEILSSCREQLVEWFEEQITQGSAALNAGAARKTTRKAAS
jgi:hypothetical protein